jgi:pimeloyl-ACP methyl ester carboxylesterase
MGERLMLPAWAAWALERPGQSRRVRVDGIELHTLCWSADDTPKPPLLFVHGHRAHAHWWDFIAPFFAQTHRVFAMDLSGMGDSDRRSTYPAGIAGRDIAGLVEALGLAPVTLIGHSNGGLRALRACGDAPELFKRAIAIDSYPVFEGGRHPTEPAGLKGDRVYPDLASALARYRLMPEQPHVEPWMLAHVARHSVREVAGGWRWKFDPLMPSGLAQEDDGNVLLAAVRCPVHYVYGSASAIVSDALAERIVRQLPQGHGPIAVPGGHHHLMFDEPVALISTLKALLA